MNTYTNRVLTKLSPFYKRRIESGRYLYPCPGNKYHQKPHKAVGMFNRWVGRGNKAYSLYWRMHPTELKP